MSLYSEANTKMDDANDRLYIAQLKRLALVQLAEQSFDAAVLAADDEYKKLHSSVMKEYEQWFKKRKAELVAEDE